MLDTIHVDRREIARQIGGMNIAAISGGRIRAIQDGIGLPVSHGYTVEVILDPSDTYTVRRVFTRAGKRSIKGERSNVYLDEVGQAAYYASSFRSYDENEWVVKA